MVRLRLFAAVTALVALAVLLSLAPAASAAAGFTATAREPLLAALEAYGASPSPPPLTEREPPPRPGDSPCNGTRDFNFNNIVTRDITAGIARENPSAVKPDGTLDSAKINHAHLLESGHLAIQVQPTPGTGVKKVTIAVFTADTGWTYDSTDAPAYVTASTGQEDPTHAAQSDSFVGGRFVFMPATDIFPDGNFVARITAFRGDGSVVGYVCADVTVQNGQGISEALTANTDAEYEPAPNFNPAFGPDPQPVLWFPAGEPSAVQRDGYPAQTLRIEFANPLRRVSVERAEAGAGGQVVWVDFTRLLTRDDFRRTHSITGRSFDATPAQDVPLLTNKKVLGPGYRFRFAALPGAHLPSERLRISATDLAGRSFCGLYSFSPGANASFVSSTAAPCTH